MTTWSLHCSLVAGPACRGPGRRGATATAAAAATVQAALRFTPQPFQRCAITIIVLRDFGGSCHRSKDYIPTKSTPFRRCDCHAVRIMLLEETPPLRHQVGKFHARFSSKKLRDYCACVVSTVNGMPPGHLPNFLQVCHEEFHSFRKTRLFFASSIFTPPINLLGIRAAADALATGCTCDTGIILGCASLPILIMDPCGSCPFPEKKITGPSSPRWG